MKPIYEVKRVTTIVGTVIFVVMISIWATVFYVAYHFISKWW